MIIDCHGHYTTSPRQHEGWRNEQIEAHTAGKPPPPRATITDDEIRQSIEGGQFVQAAKRAYDGNRVYQPVLALWAEQDVIVADEFRDGNVPAGSGNRRVVEKALAALPGGIAKVYLRGDSALYAHELMGWLDEQAIGYEISADMSPQLSQCIAALPEDHWKLDREETDALRE